MRQVTDRPGGDPFTPATPLPPTRHDVAYVGLFLFTLVLYIRPNDLLPIGQFPVAKIIGIGTLIAFLLEELSSAQPFSIRPKELKYLLGMLILMFFSVPLAIDPGESIDTIFDAALKVAIIFILLLSVVLSLERLRGLMNLTVLCGAGIAIGTLANFLTGENLIAGYRATGLVGGMFGNPNDLALALNMLIPLAIGLFLTSTSLRGRLAHLASVAIMAIAVYATYSRGGFLTLVATAAYMYVAMEKRFKRLALLLVFAALAFIVADTSLYGARILSIFESSLDQSVARGSAGARTEILKRALSIFFSNPKVWLVGIGIGNFHIVSTHEEVSHNSYLDVLTEVGLPAFILYMLFLFGAFTGLKRIIGLEKQSPNAPPLSLLATSIRASLVAYMVGSFFASVAYQWYLYYVAGYAVCLRQIATSETASL